MEKFFDLIRWWWENNVDYLRVNDPWVIPLIAISVPLSLVLRAVSSLIAVWRGESKFTIIQIELLIHEVIQMY